MWFAYRSQKLSKYADSHAILFNIMATVRNLIIGHSNHGFAKNGLDD